jgi:hypothetical protein
MNCGFNFKGDRRCFSSPPAPLQGGEGDSEPLHPSSVDRAGIVTVETGIPSELLRKARRLRKNQTEAEHIIVSKQKLLSNWTGPITS